MKFSVTLITRRQLAIELFNSMRSKAVLGALARRLARRAGTALAEFSEIIPCLNPGRSYAGIQNIRLDQITGSVGRASDFDSSFRPLEAHLRERWVSNYLHMQAGNLETILLYQVGSQYFVEDGHHRVSAARAAGMVYIEAEVWEYHFKSAPVTAGLLPVHRAESWRDQPAAAYPCAASGQNA